MDAAPAGRGLERAALLLLAATVLFNFALALINRNLAPVSGTQLVVVQGALLAGALGLGLLGRGPDRVTWGVVLWGMTLWWLGLSLLRGWPDPKYLGDVAAFPALAMLGALVRPRAFVPLLVGLQAVIVGVGLWELLAPDAYAAALGVPEYYVNTRGFDPAKFREELGGLFLNADRPGGRVLLAFTGWRRVSSVFLEPVSLGNWTVVVTVFLAVLWRWMGWGARALLIAGNLVLLVMCDGRLALMGCAVVIAFSLLAPVLPRAVPLLLPVGAFAALVLLQWLGALPPGGDTITGRLAKGLLYFERLSLEQAMGVGYVPAYTFDSGWAYFTATQGLFGFAAFWVLVVFLMPPRTIEARRVVLGVTLFFTLGLPVSNSFLSIKAAALLFAGYGSIRRWQRADAGEPAPAPAPRAWNARLGHAA